MDIITGKNEVVAIIKEKAAAYGIPNNVVQEHPVMHRGVWIAERAPGINYRILQRIIPIKIQSVNYNI